MRIASFILILCGCVVMIGATVRYARLLRETRAQAYTSQVYRLNLDKLCLLMMLLFIAGYIVGMVHTLLNDVDPIFNFVAVIFFFGGWYIAVAVRVQADMVSKQRERMLEGILTFVKTIDAKDIHTVGHSQDVYAVVSLLYDKLEDGMQKSLNKPKLLDAALLHDIGRIHVPESVIKKSGIFDDDDWACMQRHPRAGMEMLSETCFRDIGEWVMYHHERMDGKGYYNISGDQIPIESKLIAIADTYCAIRRQRSYKGGRKHEEAIAAMIESKDAQHDSALIKRFMLIKKDDLEAVFLSDSRIKSAKVTV